MSVHNTPIVQDTVNVWLARDGAELAYGILAVAKVTMNTSERRACNLVMLTLQAALGGHDAHQTTHPVAGVGG